MNIAWAHPLPEFYVPVAQSERTETAVETITMVQNDELGLTKKQSACIQSHVVQSVKKAADDANDWHDTVQIGSAYEDRRTTCSRYLNRSRAYGTTTLA